MNDVILTYFNSNICTLFNDKTNFISIPKNTKTGDWCIKVAKLTEKQLAHVQLKRLIWLKDLYLHELNIK